MWRDCVPEEGETVILTTEDRIDDYHRKIAALRVHLGADFDAGLVASRLHFIDLAGTPVRFVASERGEMFIPTDHVDILAEVLRELAPRADWITLETVSRLTGGIENNSSLSILVEATQRLCKLTGPRVAATLVAHVSQDAARNGTADAYSSRGGSALGDNGRSSMVLTGLNENNVEKFAPGVEIDPEQMKRLIVFAHPKGNGTPPTEPVILQRHSTPYGPVLELADLERPFSTQGIKPKGKGGRPQTMALDQLQKAIVEAIIIASNVITANGVFEVVGGSRNRCMATIKDMVLAGNLSDAGLGLEVVLNPFSTNLIPVEYQSGSTGSGTGTRKPPYKNKGGFSGTRYHPTGTEVMEFSTTTADQTNSQPEDQPLTKQGDD